MRLSKLIAGAGIAAAQTVDHSDITGTWSSKSNSTITGSGFYNPTSDQFVEPSHPGISYSFTDDGYYEEAYYRAIANPTSPECASGVLQFQHGTFTKSSNGSLILTPIAIDGRQLESAPCKSNKATYSRYNQSELFERYSQYTDLYHGIPRLDLYQFNGAPLQPLYLVYKPPQMNPTTTLHPASSTASAAATGSKHRRRDLAAGADHEKRFVTPGAYAKDLLLDADKWWYFGVGMTGIGSVMYYFF